MIVFPWPAQRPGSFRSRSVPHVESVGVYDRITNSNSLAVLADARGGVLPGMGCRRELLGLRTPGGRSAAADRRARLARGGPVGPHDGRRASVRRAPDRRDPGAVGALLEVRPRRRPPPGTRRSRPTAIGCARSSASSIPRLPPAWSGSATTRTRRSWRRRVGTACTRSAGRCSTGVSAEGLLVEPVSGAPAAHSSSCPMPVRRRSRSSAWRPACRPNGSSPGWLAESGCELLIPVLVRRELIETTDAQLQQSQQTWREWLYRQAFHMGRHLIGYEVQKVLAAVDGFRARRGAAAKVGVVGYAEGGLVAFYAAAIDPRIDGALVSGYFDRRGARLGGADRPQRLEPARAVRRCRDRLAGAAAPSGHRACRGSVVHEQQGRRGRRPTAHRSAPSSTASPLSPAFPAPSLVIGAGDRARRARVHGGARRRSRSASGFSLAPEPSGRPATDGRRGFDPAARHAAHRRGRSSGTSRGWCARRSTSATRRFFSRCCRS